MKIRTNANHHFFNIHCPSCGSDTYFRPRTNLAGWHRCKVCGLDIMQRDKIGTCEIVCVMEEYKNPVYDKSTWLGEKE